VKIAQYQVFIFKKKTKIFAFHWNNLIFAAAFYGLFSIFCENKYKKRQQNFFILVP